MWREMGRLVVVRARRSRKLIRRRSVSLVRGSLLPLMRPVPRRRRERGLVRGVDAAVVGLLRREKEAPTREVGRVGCALVPLVRRRWCPLSARGKFLSVGRRTVAEVVPQRLGRVPGGRRGLLLRPVRRAGSEWPTCRAEKVWPRATVVPVWLIVSRTVIPPLLVRCPLGLLTAKELFLLQQLVLRV